MADLWQVGGRLGPGAGPVFQSVWTLPAGIPNEFLKVTNIRYDPMFGNHIALWDGAAWQDRQYGFFPGGTTPTLTINTLVGNRPADVFGYWNGSNMVLEALSWSSATVRATALARRNGVLVKSTDHTRRYLGSVYITVDTGINVIYDGPWRRHFYNHYNQVPRHLWLKDYTNATSWGYNTQAWRMANNQVNNNISVMVGMPGHSKIELRADEEYTQVTASQTGKALVGIARPGSFTPVSPLLASGSNKNGTKRTCHAFLFDEPTAIGVAQYDWVEFGEASGTVFYNNGLTGWVWQ